MFQLNQDILLGGPGQPLSERAPFIFSGHNSASRLGMGEPRRHGRKALDGVGLQQPPDGTAVRVAADNHVFHPESGHGEFNGCFFSAVGSAVRRDNVPRIAQDEQLTGFRVGYEIRIDARVGAGNEQSYRLLALGQPLEQPQLGRKYVLPEMVHAFDKCLHDQPRREMDRRS
jgi:hypothetical protein